MIMSKKKTKQTNTILQSKNKKNMKMGSSKTPEYSPIKFDWFGRVCRFVNRKGDVLPTDTEMFGCKIVEGVPDYVRDFLNQMGLGEFIGVPVSNKEGITGSGKRGECHKNSLMLSLSIGGHSLYGYSVDTWDENDEDGKVIKYTLFHPHSVWITPEGKTRCVTDYNEYDVEGGNVDDVKSRLFLPIGLNDIDIEFGFDLDKIVINDSQKSICEILDWENPPSYSVKKRKVLVEKVHKRGHFFPTKIWECGESDRRRIVENSYFGKVSLFSGRSWDYYKNKILNTYFPTPQTQSII